MCEEELGVLAHVVRQRGDPPTSAKLAGLAREHQQAPIRTLPLRIARGSIKI